MSNTFTRRTHIVRVPMDNPPNAGKPPSKYMDIEVLDAIAFRVERGKEVILDISTSVPWIVDDTGGGHKKEPDDPSQRTHMQRLVNPSDSTQKLDIEVLDCWAANDQNGDVWILDMQPGSGNGPVYNISDGTGDRSATRRVHTEIITSPSGKTKADAKKSYVTSIRADNISFTKLLGREVILSMPSCDDPNSANVDFGRASTYIVTPQGYDPNNDKGPTPATLAESGDPHNYVNPVAGATGFLTGDAKIAMGPFWWIRKIKSGEQWLEITIIGNNAPGLGYNTTASVFQINATDLDFAPDLPLMFNNLAPKYIDENGDQTSSSNYENATPGKAYTITADDLTTKQHFSDGTEATAFGVYLSSTKLLDLTRYGTRGFNNGVATVTLIKLDTGGTSSTEKFTFQIEVASSGPTVNPALIQVTLFKAGLSAGETVFADPADGTDPVIASSATLTTVGSIDHFMTFQVDPANLEVTITNTGGGTIIPT